MSTRPLPSNLQEIAVTEINEKPDQILDDVEMIKDWLVKEPHLNGRIDDQWILTYLRGCKFRHRLTKDKIDYYYSLRNLSPKFFTKRDPMQPEVQHVLNRRVVAALETNSTGPQAFFVRAGNSDKKVTIPSLVKTSLMILEVLQRENDYMLMGQQVFIDLKNIDLARISELTITDARLLISLQHAYPVRIKRIVLFNAPEIIRRLYDLFCYLLSEKIRNRICFYSEENLKLIQETMPTSILPREYGGEGSWDTITDYWKHKLESYRDWFIDDDKYGVDETKRIEKYDIDRVEGSFRKLEVD